MTPPICLPRTSDCAAQPETRIVADIGADSLDSIELVIPNYGGTMSFGRPHTVHLRLLNPLEE